VSYIIMGTDSTSLVNKAVRYGQRRAGLCPEASPHTLKAKTNHRLLARLHEIGEMRLRIASRFDELDEPGFACFKLESGDAAPKVFMP
jgi:hypothetical protein